MNRTPRLATIEIHRFAIISNFHWFAIWKFRIEISLFFLQPKEAGVCDCIQAHWIYPIRYPVWYYPRKVNKKKVNKFWGFLVRVARKHCKFAWKGLQLNFGSELDKKEPVYRRDHQSPNWSSLGSLEVGLANLCQRWSLSDRSPTDPGSDPWPMKFKEIRWTNWRSFIQIRN